MEEGKGKRHRETKREEVEAGDGATETGLAGGDACGRPEQVMPRQELRVDSRRAALQGMPAPPAPHRRDTCEDLFRSQKWVEGIPPVATRTQAFLPVACDRPPKAAMNHPVVVLPVEKQITSPRCRRQRNRENRVPSAQVRDHTRVPRRNDDDRRPVSGQHQLEGLVA